MFSTCLAHPILFHLEARKANYEVLPILSLASVQPDVFKHKNYVN